MSGGSYILGVDGGGSKTEAVLECLGTGTRHLFYGNALNSVTDGMDKASRHLLELLNEAEDLVLANDGRMIGIAIATACNSGPWKQRHWSVAMVEQLFPGALIQGMEDTEAALEGALAGGPGIVVIAGTGSVSIACTPEGTIRSCGGWGPWFGDEGSGYAIGCDALRAAARAADGRGKLTILKSLLEKELGIATFNPAEAAEKVYNGWGRKRIATLSRLVSEAAHAGDETALSILDAAAEQLAELAKCLYFQLDWLDPVKVSYAGGLFDMGDLLLIPFQKYLDSENTGVLRLSPPQMTPVLGALEAARKLTNGQTAQQFNLGGEERWR